VVISTLLEKESIKSDYVEHKKKLTEISNIKDKIYGNFVDPGQVDSLVDYLEKLGKDNGTDLSVSSIDPVRDSKSIVITVSIKGSFSKVINSISLIENSPYQVHINSIYLNKDSSVALDPKSGKAVSSSADKWRADLSFNMLTF
jgi:hypothetical protein